MKKTLKSTLIIPYSLIAVLLVLTLSVLFNVTETRTFEQYAKKQRKNQISRIVAQVGMLYDEQTGSYDQRGIEMVGYAALQNGIIMQLENEDKTLDWDIRNHRAEECSMVLQHAEENMNQKYPNFKGGYTEEQYPLIQDGKVTGTLKLGYYGPYSLSDGELELMKSLDKSLLIIGAAALCIVAVLGMLIARAVTDPVTGVIRTAQRIAGGEYGTQAEKNSSIAETALLIEAINEMSLKLEENEKQKRRITSDVAHELRTPLTNLQTHMEAMIDEVWETTTARLESCHAEILRLVGIVEQLQELYLLENKEQAPDKRRFDFRELCMEVFDGFEIKAKEKNIRLLMAMPPKTPIYADYYRLKQCMINLISNALAYTPGGGHIAVEYRMREGHVEIKVRDDGPGIPEEDISHLFERFYRVDKSRSKKTGGMGIGLAITKAIVKMHGGEISAENQNGQGAVFTINLPYQAG